MTLESALVLKIKKALIAEGAYAAKIHGNRFSQGIPDLLICYKGRFIAMEVKRPEGRHKVSDLQQHNIDQINKAGGVALDIYSVDQALDVLKEVDNEVEDRKTRRRKGRKAG